LQTSVIILINVAESVLLLFPPFSFENVQIKTTVWP